MKLFQSLGMLLLAVLLITACEKEYSEENGSTASAVGTLKEDASGECLPSSVSGVFRAGATLSSSNVLQVTVNFTTTGTYLIVSDTVNGYFFRGVGVVAIPGETQVSMMGVGRPVAAGSNTFTVRFGASNCNIVVDVLPAGAGAAVFTPAGTPATCATATIAGIYRAGTPLTASNTVTVGVNVTTPGTYSVTIPVANGISFTGTGSLTATGLQDIVLVASGTPTAAGNFNYVINGTTGNCTFTVPVTGSGGSAAVYTLGGAPTNCTGFVVAGTYQAGLATGAANTARFNVNVTTPGTYTITTTAVNGVTFSGSGTFAAAGPQLVTLTASGTPAAAGPFNYPATGAASTCSFSVTYNAAGAAAVYTLVGAGGACTPGTVQGTYTVGTALAAGNTVTIQANVTTPGTYTLTSNAANGMTFSATGSFVATGPQTIVLTGTGTPVAAGSNTFSVGSTACTFAINAVAGTATDFISFRIDGGAAVTYTVNADAILTSTAVPVLDLYAEQAAVGVPSMQILLAKTTGGAITAGTYTVNQLITGVLLGAFYTDANSIEYSAETAAIAQNPGFTLIISTITATRVTGTFSGVLKEGGTGPAIRTISQGTFSLALP